MVANKSTGTGGQQDKGDVPAKKKSDKTAEDTQDKAAREASQKATTDFNKAQAEAKGEKYGDE